MSKKKAAIAVKKKRVHAKRISVDKILKTLEKESCSIEHAISSLREQKEELEKQYEHQLSFYLGHRTAMLIIEDEFKKI